VKGIYALVILLKVDANVRVGASREFRLRKGKYVYVGSAQANLEQRVKRHLRRDKRLFWHIDYLLNTDVAEAEKILYLEGKKSEECALATEIGQRGEAVPGFGCSDCRCISHLFRVADSSFLFDRMKPLSF
jgi:Uri superfamily endonuclease